MNLVWKEKQTGIIFCLTIKWDFMQRQEKSSRKL